MIRENFFEHATRELPFCLCALFDTAVIIEATAPEPFVIEADRLTVRADTLAARAVAMFAGFSPPKPHENFENHIRALADRRIPLPRALAQATRQAAHAVAQVGTRGTLFDSALALAKSGCALATEMHEFVAKIPFANGENSLYAATSAFCREIAAALIGMGSGKFAALETSDFAIFLAAHLRQSAPTVIPSRIGKNPPIEWDAQPPYLPLARELCQKLSTRTQNPHQSP